MTTWVIVSWVSVALLTGINIFVFLKLKKASLQMMQMAFPGVTDMNEAVSKMQQMMNRAGGGFPGGQQRMRRGGKGKGRGRQDAQLQQAMEMLQNLQGGKRR